LQTQSLVRFDDASGVVDSVLSQYFGLFCLRQQFVTGSEVGLVEESDFLAASVADEDVSKGQVIVGLNDDIRHFTHSSDRQREHVLANAFQVDHHHHVIGFGNQRDEDHFDVHCVFSFQGC